MKNAQDPATLEMLNQGGARFHRRQQHVIHVECLVDMCGDLGQGDIVGHGPGAQTALIPAPDFLAARLNCRRLFKLRQQKKPPACPMANSWNPGQPGVFVDLTAEEAAAIGAFFRMISARSIRPGSVISRGAAFATGEVLGFMKAQRRQFAKGAEAAALVARKETMGVVFDDGRYFAHARYP